MVESTYSACDYVYVSKETKILNKDISSNTFYGKLCKAVAVYQFLYFFFHFFVITIYM